jgi:HlyD family secretion protein
VQVTRGPIVAAIATNGKVEPVNNFEAHAPAPTSVEKLLAKEGQQVKPGQFLLRLDDADARAEAARALAQMRAAQAELAALQSGGTREEVLTTRAELTKTRAELDAAERNLEAMRRLQQKGAASLAEVRNAENRVQTLRAQIELLEKKLSSRFAQPDIARAEAQLEQARAAYAAAQQLLRETNIRAPRAGTLYSLPVREGQFVSQGELLLQVADLDPVLVRAFVDEPDIGRLRGGQQVLVTWDALPERTWEGQITQLPTTVNTRGTRTVGEVTSMVNNDDHKLLPNVNVSVSILTTRAPDAVTVPREAVRQEDGRNYVYRIEGDILQRQYVETGISNLTDVQITNGLSEGMRVATRALSGVQLKEGMAVRVEQ